MGLSLRCSHGGSDCAERRVACLGIGGGRGGCAYVRVRTPTRRGARGLCEPQVVDELDRTRAYELLKRLTDCHRMHLFDVVMQYRAIFADDTSTVEAAEGADGGLLYSWATHRVGVYLREVEAALPGIVEGSSLASVLDHCMYCGMSLGRVGLDFRALLPPLFEARVAGIVHNALSVTVDVLDRCEHNRAVRCARLCRLSVGR